VDLPRCGVISRGTSVVAEDDAVDAVRRARGRLWLRPFKPLNQLSRKAKGHVPKRNLARVCGPFVGLNDPFVECRFSLVEVSLGYNVLPGLELLAKPTVFIALSPFCQERR
jgi:hypothetical protein